MPNRTAALAVEALKAADVRTCYGIVGDTLNRIAHDIDRSEIDWVHVREEEAGAFPASAEALITGRLTACAGSCGHGSLHFVSGPLRGQSQPPSRHPDRDPDRAAGHRVRGRSRRSIWTTCSRAANPASTWAHTKQFPEGVVEGQGMFTSIRKYTVRRSSAAELERRV